MSMHAHAKAWTELTAFDKAKKVARRLRNERREKAHAALDRELDKLDAEEDAHLSTLEREVMQEQLQ